MRRGRRGRSGRRGRLAIRRPPQRRLHPLQERHVPFRDRADPAECNGSVAVEDHRCRQPARMEELPGHGLRVERDVVLDAEFLDELDHQVAVRAPVHRHAQDAEPLVPVSLVQGLEVGGLLAAGVAPGRPEIDQERVAAVVGKRDRGAVVQGGGREVGSGIAAAQGGRLAGNAGREDQRREAGVDDAGTGSKPPLRGKAAGGATQRPSTSCAPTSSVLNGPTPWICTTVTSSTHM